jgi:hypothetical protein
VPGSYDQRGFDFFCCERDDGERTLRGADVYLLNGPAQLIPFLPLTHINRDLDCHTTAFEKVRAQPPRHNNKLAKSFHT